MTPDAEYCADMAVLAYHHSDRAKKARHVLETQARFDAADMQVIRDFVLDSGLSKEKIEQLLASLRAARKKREDK